MKNQNQYYFTAVFIAIFSLFASCNKNEDTLPSGNVVNDSELAAELLKSPVSVLTDNKIIKISNYLWRDFMPISEENGSSLRCVSTLRNSDSSVISQSLKLKKLYVINESEIWITEFSEINTYEKYVSGFAGNGPKWGPYIAVDVVCEFENSGNLYRIKSTSELINRTD